MAGTDVGCYPTAALAGSRDHWSCSYGESNAAEFVPKFEDQYEAGHKLSGYESAALIE